MISSEGQKKGNYKVCSFVGGGKRGCRVVGCPFLSLGSSGDREDGIFTFAASQTITVV